MADEKILIIEKISDILDKYVYLLIGDEMNFGIYFRKLRKSKQVTQKTISKAIGKSLMLISGVETSKNGQFTNEDLKIIAECLSLSHDEYINLQIQASKERGMLPPHMTDYIADHDGVISFLKFLFEEKWMRHY